MLKKIIAAVLGIIICVALNSCADKEEKINDRFIFTSYTGTLLVYDVITGKIAYACTDPLCSHNNDNCDFYGIEADITVTPTLVYFTRNISFTQNELYCYNISSEKVSRVYATSEYISGIYETEGTVYFNGMLYKKNENGNLNVEYSLYRLDADGNIKKLAENLDETLMLIGHKDGRLIWEGTELSEVFTSDYDFQNIAESTEKESTIYNGWKISCDVEYDAEAGCAVFKVIRENTETGQTVPLVSRASDVRLEKEKILYLPVSDEPTVIGQEKDSKEDVIYAKSTELHIIDLSTFEDTVLCDIPSDCYVYSLSGWMTNPLTVGDYIGIPTLEYTFEEGYIAGNRMSDSLIIINLQNDKAVKAE